MPLRLSVGTNSRAERLVALVLLCASLTASGAEPARAPTLTLQPASFRLWKDTTAVVEFESQSAVDEVRFSSSLGRVDTPVRRSPTRFTAMWHPPAEGYPQVAIVVAHARRGTDWTEAFGTLPLSGLGDAVVQATPNSRITVRIGSRTFGPVATGNQGLTRVPVEVPPGEHFAWHGEKAISLGVPDSKHVHASIAVDTARSDQTAVVPVHLFAVTPFGVPQSGAKFQLTAEKGSLSEISELTPGHYLVKWTVQADAARPVKLRAALSTEPRFESLVQLRGKQGPPFALTLSVDGGELRADHPELSGQVRALDAMGRAVPAPVSIASALCEQARVIESSPGVYAFNCHVRPHFGGQRELELTASTPGEQGVVSASMKVPLRAGPPSRISVEPDSDSVPGDGRSTVQLRVTAFDAFGNPVDAASTIAAVAAGGALELVGVEPTSEVSSRVAVLRAQRQLEDAETTVEVSLGEARGKGTVHVAAYRPWFTLTPHVGFASNLKDVNAPWLAAAAELWRPIGRVQLGLAVEAGRLAFGSDAPLSGRGTTEYVSGFGGPVVALSLSPHWTGSLSVGGGMARVSDRLRLDGQPETSASGWVPAGYAQAGVQWAVWNGGPELMGRVSRYGNPSLPTLSGALTAFSVSVGYRIDLR